MKKFPMIRRAERQAALCFAGIALPCYKSKADGGQVWSEKVLKFNRASLKEIVKPKARKVDARMIGGEDRMILAVGKPGSPERVQALIEQYNAIQAAGEEISPFRED